MTDDPTKPGIAGFSLDSIILAPGKALDALDAYERNRLNHNKRINDLLEANNRYLNDMRAAKAEAASYKKSFDLLRIGIRAVH